MAYKLKIKIGGVNTDKKGNPIPFNAFFVHEMSHHLGLDHPHGKNNQNHSHQLFSEDNLDITQMTYNQGGSYIDTVFSEISGISNNESQQIVDRLISNGGVILVVTNKVSDHDAAIMHLIDDVAVKSYINQTMFYPNLKFNPLNIMNIDFGYRINKFKDHIMELFIKLQYNSHTLLRVPLTLMPKDIAALKEIWRWNSSAVKNKKRFSYNCKPTTSVVYDVESLDASQCRGDSVLDMNPGAWSSVGVRQGFLSDAGELLEEAIDTYIGEPPHMFAGGPCKKQGPIYKCIKGITPAGFPFDTKMQLTRNSYDTEIFEAKTSLRGTSMICENNLPNFLSGAGKTGKTTFVIHPTPGDNDIIANFNIETDKIMLNGFVQGGNVVPKLLKDDRSFSIIPGKGYPIFAMNISKGESDSDTLITMHVNNQTRTVVLKGVLPEQLNKEHFKFTSRRVNCEQIDNFTI